MSAVVFCPVCGNHLILDPNGPMESAQFRYACQVCPYVHDLRQYGKLKTRVDFKRKEVDDVLGGDAAWANVDKTKSMCGCLFH
jgi:DNA-directed RNA polymerase III subunit RPC11